MIPFFMHFFYALFLLKMYQVFSFFSTSAILDNWEVQAERGRGYEGKAFGEYGKKDGGL